MDLCVNCPICSKSISIKIYNKSSNPLPMYATSGSSGLDLIANLQDNVVINRGETRLIKTGIHISIPSDCIEAQIRSRSGLALKNGIFVLNSPGTIDSDYRGEIGVVLHNTNESFTVTNGMRIAQLVFVPIIKVNLIPVNTTDELDSTDRGEDGFGSTGTIV